MTLLKYYKDGEVACFAERYRNTIPRVGDQVRFKDRRFKDFQLFEVTNVTWLEDEVDDTVAVDIKEVVGNGV